MDKRILLAVGAVAAAVVLFVVLRPDDENATTSTQPGATTTTATTTEETTTTLRSPPAAPPPLVLVVRNGRAVGGVKRPSVSRGDRVVVVVRADVADEVHVHGYDLMGDVAPGKPARIAFRARLVGVFEIELEDRHLLLAELEVQP